MQNTNILASFCYDGKDFGLVDEDTIVQIGGAYIILWDTSRNQKGYIKAPRQNGYSQVTSSSNMGLIAATEYGLQPECHIYRSRDRELLHTFKMQTTLKCLSSCFSRNAKYLLMIGGVPDFRISIFDLEEQKLLTMPENKLPFSHKNFLQVSFNPKNKNMFCIVSDTTIYFYTLKPAFQSGGAMQDQDNEGAMQEELVDAYRLDVEEFHAADVPIPDEQVDPITFTSLKWDAYNRVHVCTNTMNLYQVTSKAPQIEQTLALNGIPMTTIVTQKHMIVATDEGIMQWYKIEPPYDGMGDKDADQMCLKLLDEIDQEYNFSDQLREENKAPVAFMHYSKSYKRIVIGARNGVLGRLYVEAEVLDEDEDEDDVQGDKEKKIIEVPLEILGRFHTAGIKGIRALANSSQFITISDDNSVALWEATNGKQLAVIRQFVLPTSLEVSVDGKVAFVGSDAGAFRIYDISNRSLPRLILQLRFYQDVIPITSISCSPDGKIVLISSKESDTIFICSQRPQDEFEIYGYIKMEGIVLSSNLIKHENRLCALAVLSNNLIQSVVVPVEKQSGRLEPIPNDFTEPGFRKVDRGCNFVHANPEMKKFYVSGDDKFLKYYQDHPSDKFEKIDWRKAPIQPNNEFSSHSLGVSCSDFGNETFISGGKDGTLLARPDGSFDDVTQAVTHSVACGGITALCQSKSTGLSYTGGGDGSIFIVAFGMAEFPMQPVNPPLEGTDIVAKIKSQEPQYVDQLKLFKDIMLAEFYRLNEIKKEQFKKDIMIGLNDIRNKLQNLLKDNTRVTEIEKLDRNEFVIDVQKQEHFIEEGESVCNEIREQADKTTLRLELLRERVIDSTWEKMDVQSKATKSIQGETLLYNYSIRKRTTQEERVLQQVIMQRKIELRQKYQRMEKQLSESLDELEFSKTKEGFFMNRQATKPEFLDDDSIMEAAAEFAAKDAEKKARRDAEELSKLQANTKDNEGKRKPYLKITKGRLGMKTKKKDPEEEARLAAAQKTQARDIKGMEEIHWKVVHTKKELEYLKKTLDAHNIYDILYDSFELYTDKRKRVQIELLREVVFELKRDFNKEFTQLNAQKDEVLYNISEKNDQIRELLENLKQIEEIKEPEPHPLENPENIFEIKDDEIKVEKYLTKEEKALQDEEERIKREREEALKGDNVGQRGLKQMMGGTELVMKKEKNMLEMELVREDWMNKPEDDMSEEEKQKYKEFLQKEKEFKEKQRKAWEINLKKVKHEIEEFKAKYEESLLQLYKKRLFYDARIYEQELYIIRLIIMLHDISETGENCEKQHEEFLKIQEKLQEKNAFLHNCHDQMIEFENKIRQDSTNVIKKQEEEVKLITTREGLQNTRNVLNFVRTGRSNARVQVSEQEKSAMSTHIVELDPYSIIDRDEVNALIKIMELEEKYDYDTHKLTGDVSREMFSKLVEERTGRIQINQSIEKNNKRLASLKDFIFFYETEKNKVQEEFDEVDGRRVKFEERKEKLKFNFEVITYLKQGQVEIPPLPVATDYKDAILVSQDVIEGENGEIHARGEEKVNNMNQILKHKTTLKQVTCENKRLEYQIVDFEERAKDVQLYRVTKQTQEIIQGKHQKKDEEDKKRLDNQIKQLEDNAIKRKAAIQQTELKLQKEIREKTQENSQLEAKAWKLKNNVTQRKQIINLRVSTNNDRASDPSTKIKQIAHQRKLLDVIKQQEEEIMFLKDELDRLRARTFPSFAHLQNKAEYPDDR